MALFLQLNCMEFYKLTQAMMQNVYEKNRSALHECTLFEHFSLAYSWLLLLQVKLIYGTFILNIVQLYNIHMCVHVLLT